MSKFTNPRILHTNFYSLEFKQLLDRFFWNLANAEEKRMQRNGDLAATEVAPDGEILINFGIDKYGWYKTIYAKKKTDDAILDWIGWMMKVKTHELIEDLMWKMYLPSDTIAAYLKAFNADDCRKIDAAKKAAKKAEWKRDSDMDVPFLSISEEFAQRMTNIGSKMTAMTVKVKDVYFVYDALKNRKGCDRRYDESIVKRWRGQKKDPLATEMEVARRAEVERITAEYKRMIEDLDPDYRYGAGVKGQSSAYNELQRIMNEFKDKCKAERKRLIAEREEKLKELEAMCQIAI